MRYFLIVGFFLVVSSAFSQTLKKKYSGRFEGTMPAYSIILANDAVQVKGAEIQIELLTDGTCSEKIGGVLQQGTYKIVQEDKTVYTLEITFKGQFITEKYLLYKSEKQVERKGIYPQPDVFLRKN